MLTSSDGWANIREKKSAMMIAGMRSRQCCLGAGGDVALFAAGWPLSMGTNISLRLVP